ncbi:MAG: MlaD family protein, partial [Solirubrobacterales bacterium]
MSKRAPSTMQLIVIAGFALSCFGILLFLWVTFGGPTPFKAKPYEIKVPFSEATQLAEQSDVRISGVNVGKVQSIALAPNGKQALATVDIDDKYGPLPESTRAILRTKTLLAETYVELTPGNRDGPKLEDGAQLAAANVASSVQIDEIFRTFDPKTRAAFQEWMQTLAVAIDGRGQSLSTAFGELDTTF